VNSGAQEDDLRENHGKSKGNDGNPKENHGKSWEKLFVVLCREKFFKSLQPSLRDIHQSKEEYYEFARINNDIFTDPQAK